MNSLFGGFDRLGINGRLYERLDEVIQIRHELGEDDQLNSPNSQANASIAVHLIDVFESALLMHRAVLNELGKQKAVLVSTASNH